ncbi:MAG TPA: AmmeMemoRadiSam system protein B [Gaiellaceae bacterium]|nr:AmmeMemoRadiSam system protein B [Gaiellaceae bacterium]
MSGRTRSPAAAGTFYPADPEELRRIVDSLLAAVPARTGGDGGAPVALVAPHAGYVYSGATAAAALALLPPRARVALLGPSHFVPLDGCAVSGADGWATPLGTVPVADDLRDAAVAAGAVVDDRPHARDHALEVELPFLQRVCREGVEIVAVAVGRSPAADAARVVAALAADATVVVSTDLSHYLDGASARRVDRATAAAVLARDASAIGVHDACGVFALRGLVEHARRAGWEPRLLDLRTSADATGDDRSVVGYGAFAFVGA